MNHPAIAPVEEAKPNTEVFRLLAVEMGFADAMFRMTDAELARRSWSRPDQPTFDSLLTEGPLRLNLPKDWLPFAEGHFPTPSGKCEFYSPREAAAGRDPLPHYIPPHEDPQTRPDLAAKYPLQMVTPPVPSFLNSSFVNIDVLRKAAGEPVVEMHADDAAARGIVAGQAVRVFNGRGRFRAKAVVGDSVRPGVVVSFGIWWNRYTEDGVNVNTTTSTAVTDQGGGGTFFDNLVEVAAL